MNAIKVFAEVGKKKTFVGAVDWPGWCRSGRDEKSAIQTLIDCGPRYAQVLHHGKIEFQVPNAVSDFVIIERQAGNATTDFGAPAVSLDLTRCQWIGRSLNVCRSF